MILMMEIFRYKVESHDNFALSTYLKEVGKHKSAFINKSVDPFMPCQQSRFDLSFLCWQGNPFATDKNGRTFLILRSE